MVLKQHCTTTEPVKSTQIWCKCIKEEKSNEEVKIPKYTGQIYDTSDLEKHL